MKERTIGLERAKNVNHEDQMITNEQCIFVTNFQDQMTTKFGNKCGNGFRQMLASYLIKCRRNL